MSTQKTFREYSVCPWDVLFFTRDPSIIPDHGDRGGRPLAHSGMAQERPTRDLSAVDRSPPQSAAEHTTAADDRNLRRRATPRLRAGPGGGCVSRPRVDFRKAWTSSTWKSKS